MDLYLRYVEVILSRYALPELIDIWVTSLALGHLGADIREQITQVVPSMVGYHQLQLEKSTFRELVERYEEKTFFAACPEDPNYAIIHFAKKGNLAGVRYAIRQGANKIYQATKVAVKLGLVDLVAFLLSRCTEAQYTDLYLLACKHKQKAIARMLKPSLKGNETFLAALYEGKLEKARSYAYYSSDYTCSLPLKAAVYSGNLTVLEYVLRLCGLNNQTVRTLARKVGKLNHLEMIPLLEKYAYIEHELFIGAAKGGHLSLLEKPAPKVLSSLGTTAAAIRAATQGYHMEVIHFLVDHCHISVLSYAVLDAFQYENMPMLEFLLENKLKIDWVDGLIKAAEIGSRRMVDFVLKQKHVEKKYILSSEKIAREGGYPTLANYLLAL